MGTSRPHHAFGARAECTGHRVQVRVPRGRPWAALRRRTSPSTKASARAAMDCAVSSSASTKCSVSHCRRGAVGGPSSHVVAETIAVCERSSGEGVPRIRCSSPPTIASGGNLPSSPPPRASESARADARIEHHDEARASGAASGLRSASFRRSASASTWNARGEADRSAPRDPPHISAWASRHGASSNRPFVRESAVGVNPRHTGPWRVEGQCTRDRMARGEVPAAEDHASEPRGRDDRGAARSLPVGERDADEPDERCHAEEDLEPERRRLERRAARAEQGRPTRRVGAGDRAEPVAKRSRPSR